MGERMVAEQVAAGVWRFADSCNVYVVAGEGEAVAVDYGTGAWRREAAALGLPPVRHVLLTHHHPEQCGGLVGRREREFVVHAPAGEEPFLSPEGVARYWREWRQGGIPASYAVVPEGIPGVQYDLGGFADWWWGRERWRAIHTPGHGRAALSLLVTADDEQVAFCGDAAHAGATIWQPYHLEWDHWTGGGALAAWEGVVRLGSLGMAALCPAHGPVVRDRPRAMLRQLARKLLALVEVKGHVCAGQADGYVRPEAWVAGAARLSPSLYQFGCNGYLLLSADGEGLVVDAQEHELPAVAALTAALGGVRVTAATATHCHLDHTSGLAALRAALGTQVWLAPSVAAPLAEPTAWRVPWLPAAPLLPDALLPEPGVWRWGGYELAVHHFPAQTWWHTSLCTTVDGRRVFFGGDNFQPSSRWNGTGGFCAMNGAHFRVGFAASAALVQQLRPTWIATGHGTYYRYQRRQFAKIAQWAARAERAVRALCPSGELEQDYYLHRLPP